MKFTLNTLGAGVNASSMSAFSSTLSGLTNLGAIQLPNNNSLDLSGTIVNNGSINVNSVGNNTFLYMNGNVTLNGNGTVTVNVSGTWVWPGETCAARYGMGVSVDWWGLSTATTPSPNFNLTNATELAVKASNVALQLLGAAGYMKDHPMELYYRDAKQLTIVEGTSQVQLGLIARGVLDRDLWWD